MFTHVDSVWLVVLGHSPVELRDGLNVERDKASALFLNQKAVEGDTERNEFSRCDACPLPCRTTWKNFTDEDSPR